jgi:xylitol oxidase
MQVWAKFRCPAEEPLSSLHGVAAAASKRHVLPGLDPAPCTEQMGAPGPWHTRLPHFKLAFTPSAGEELQSEYFVDAKDAEAALRALETLAPQIHAILLVSEIRAVAKDQFWMSPSFQRDSIAIHFTWRQDAKAVARLLPALERLLIPFRARPHWAKAVAFVPSRVSFPTV